jgi:regulator of replication initiation timing
VAGEGPTDKKPKSKKKKKKKKNNKRKKNADASDGSGNGGNGGGVGVGAVSAPRVGSVVGSSPPTGGTQLPFRLDGDGSGAGRSGVGVGVGGEGSVTSSHCGDTPSRVGETLPAAGGHLSPDSMVGGISGVTAGTPLGVGQLQLQLHATASHDLGPGLSPASVQATNAAADTSATPAHVADSLLGERRGSDDRGVGGGGVGAASDGQVTPDQCFRMMRRMADSIESMQTVNTALTTKVDRLTTEVDRLTTENKDLRADNKSLTTRVDHLTAENKDLRADNKSLTTRVDRLTAENKDLRADNKSLTTRVDRLTADICLHRKWLLLAKTRVDDGGTTSSSRWRYTQDVDSRAAYSRRWRSTSPTGDPGLLHRQSSKPDTQPVHHCRSRKLSSVTTKLLLKEDALSTVNQTLARERDASDKELDSLR